MDSEEIEKDKFEMIMMKKHHKEMVNAIKSIKIPEPKDETELIGRLNSAVELLTKKLEVLQSPNITIEKTEINQKEVVNLLQELITKIETFNVKKEFTFDVVRDDYGTIKQVKVKQI